MAFTGTTFFFDGVSSEQYGLMLCNFDSAKQEAGRVGGKLSIQEDRIARRSTSLHYGVENNEAKEFPLVFVVSDDNRRLDRYDIASIGAWLTGHSDYKELAIMQPDLEGVFYRCIITDLEQIELGMRVVGFTATVSCDGPYAYRRMVRTTIPFNGTTSARYHNMSNVNDYYRPLMEVTCTGTELYIENTTDGTTFKLSGMPTGTRTIQIDTLNQVMTSSDGIDLYAYWNEGIDKHFPRFVRGDNNLTITGEGTLTIQNVFPWNIGH
ncbi:MAG: phage tail domain-containing protein [Oscillospiraceae bacterium]